MIRQNKNSRVQLIDRDIYELHFFMFYEVFFLRITIATARKERAKRS